MHGNMTTHMLEAHVDVSQKTWLVPSVHKGPLLIICNYIVLSACKKAIMYVSSVHVERIYALYMYFIFCDCCNCVAKLLFTFWEIKFYAAVESVVVSFTLKIIMQAILEATLLLQNPICLIAHSIIGIGMDTLFSSTAEIISESASHL